ncbi:MAG TPA: UPF0149 family protein [Candidatus Competibacteraceae bacterium]|nr:UPF0149 family protein [Candidatus Competibacteraceae bacterium]HQA26455.1 UPF0149 family protein [Candidatus Competibacteraceae bacterium]HQD55867.1 UPF0149 family protein [Candidatus Competibacteraceae bacterium]
MPATHAPLFEHLSRLLTPLDPAELHGLLCGLLCSDPTLDRARWLDLATEELIDGAELSATQADLLAKLLDYGIAQLHDPDGAVSPLLPDDDAPLTQRTEALGRWCQGLLYGLGLGRVEQASPLSAESREFLGDVAVIAQAESASDDGDNADETAYTELVEYLRVGLLTIQQDVRHAVAPADPLPH